ncbi:hypothetical protein OUZ56_022938 [Daphnia magna]|uniref:Uncharacterized protein n=1 Tax=Daphnia magna TaxID=35525 RepID=A0ABR0AXX5_9CRUS|nr:hypothetical protein OUZ56_022938 [Daphnia magna]
MPEHCCMRLSAKGPRQTRTEYRTQRRKQIQKDDNQPKNDERIDNSGQHANIFNVGFIRSEIAAFQWTQLKSTTEITRGENDSDEGRRTKDGHIDHQTFGREPENYFNKQRSSFTENC